MELEIKAPPEKQPIGIRGSLKFRPRNNIMTLVQLDIDPRKLQDDLKDRILTSAMQSLPELIINLVTEQFEKQLKNLVASGEIIRFNIVSNHGRGSPNAHLPPNRWPPRPSIIQLPWFLKDLPKEKVIDLGSFEFTIVTKRNSPQGIHFERPVNLLNSGPLEVKRQSLKTISKYIVRMGQNGELGIPASVLTPIGDTLISSCQCPSDYLAACIEGVWDWTIRFICRVCGKSYFCECYKTALEKYYEKALAERNHYSEGAWPHKFIAKYQQAEFREGICHICRDIPSELFYCHPMYGSKVMVHYGPYIMRTAIEKDIDKHEAENEIRESLGIPRISEGWISEIELLNMAKALFSNKEVIHQASPEWLGRQRLDIFIPELKLATEYQGQQHYKPISLFGGEEGFLQTQKRDKLKSKLCAENGISLVFFQYDETITRKLVETRIKRALTGQK